MSEPNIGNNIAELRKAKGITQEALADVVGLTAQAVSKWESGGSPDTSLLPAIADYFGVSIDRLFGRKTRDYSDLQAEILEYITACPINERIQRAYDLLQGTLPAYVDLPTNIEVAEAVRGVENVWKQGDGFAMILTKNGIIKVGHGEALRYCLVMPEPKDGWGQRIYHKEQYDDFFSMLADKDILKTLFYLDSRTNKNFTSKLLEKEFGIDKEKAADILGKLVKYKLVSSKELELDDELLIIYDYNSNSAFLPLMVFAEEMINRPDKSGNPIIAFPMREGEPFLARREQR